MSLRLRVALLSGIAVGLVVAVFGAAVFAITAFELYSGAVGQLRTEQVRIAARFERLKPAALPNVDGEVYINAYSPAGVPIRQARGVAARALPISPAQLEASLAAPEGTVTQYTATIEGNLYLLHAVSLQGTVLEPTTPLHTTPVAVQVVVLGIDVSGAYRAIRVLGLVLAIGGLVALVVSVGLVWLVAGRALRPVGQLTRAAETLGAGAEPWRRLPVPATGDEIARLSTAFNGSLDRLEEVYRRLAEALSQQQRFVADASHELRTPLTVILSNAENLRDQPDLPVAERTEWLGEMIEESKRMADLCSDLLLLARADAGEPMRLGDVDWRPFFDELRRDAQRLCQPRPVTTEARDPLGWGLADRSALLRVFRVLFENIARHTPDSTHVTLHAQRDAGTVVFLVGDDGPGVRPDLLPHLFDRFFRADESRHGPGTGLGLAIADQIVSRHRGQIAVRNRPGGGLEFRVQIPVTLEAQGDAHVAT